MNHLNRTFQWACFLGVCGLGAASAQAADARDYFHFSGAFHPAVAHFPIALLVVAGVVELWRAIRGKKVPGDAGYTCLMLGSAGAVAAAILGWANADHSGDFNGKQADILFFHRWLGVGVAVGSVALAVIATRTRGAGEVSRFKRFGLLAGLLLCSGLVGLTGSLGGKLTFGVDYYETVYNETIGASAKTTAVTPAAGAQPAPAPVAPVEPVTTTSVAKADPVKIAPAQPPAVGAVSPVVVAVPSPDTKPVTEAAPNPATTIARISYVTQIKPLFASNCIKCHGDTKQKGDYRLDGKQFAFEPGGSGEAPIVPGQADGSLLVKVIEGKGKYAESMMPPKGALFSAEQVALIRRWIDEGAVWDE